MKRFATKHGSKFARYGVHGHDVVTSRMYRGGIRL